MEKIANLKAENMFSLTNQSCNMHNLKDPTTEKGNFSDLNEKTVEARIERENPLPSYLPVVTMYSDKSNTANTFSLTNPSNMHNLSPSTTKKRTFSDLNEKNVQARIESENPLQQGNLLVVKRRLNQSNIHVFRWRCDLCDYETNTLNDAQEHIDTNVHSLSLPSSMYKRHGIQADTLKKLQSHPFFILPNEAEMTKIAQRHTMEDVCKEIFAELHLIGSLVNQGYSFNWSKMAPLTNQIIAVHITLENMTKIFACPFCPYGNLDLLWLRMHILKHSKLLSTYNCPFCILGFDCLEDLRTHATNFHHISSDNLNLINSVVGNKWASEQTDLTDSDVPLEPLHPNLAHLRYFLLQHQKRITITALSKKESSESNNHIPSEI